MDFKNRVILQLNRENDLISYASIYFKEPPAYIKAVIDLITEATVLALHTQASSHKKADEFSRIGKECSFLNFASVFGTDLNIIEKGRGINSEIFGVSLVHTVDEISRKTNVRNSTVHFLMASVTPAVLSVLHEVNMEKAGELSVPVH
ncbi:MAG TPA: hypothetical protein PKE30_02800 [Niabella sp.]|nr:hypothetical protein [Niabella sp.]